MLRTQTVEKGTLDLIKRFMSDGKFNNFNLGNSIFCFVNDIKIDLLPHQYPLVEGIDILEGIRIVSLQDIGAMKLNAKFNSGQATMEASTW